MSPGAHRLSPLEPFEFEITAHSWKPVDHRMTNDWKWPWVHPWPLWGESMFLNRRWLLAVLLVGLVIGCQESTQEGAEEPLDDAIGDEPEAPPDPSGIGGIGEESGDWQWEDTGGESDTGDDFETGEIFEGGEDGEPSEETGGETSVEPGETTGEETSVEPGETTGEETSVEPGDDVGEDPNPGPGEETGSPAAIPGCDGNALETFQSLVSFPSIGPGCPWGDGENLNASDTVLTACLTQEQAFTAPAGKVICSLSASVGMNNTGALPPQVQGGSCENFCCSGENQGCSPNGDCFCDDACTNFEDCCADYGYWCNGGGGGGNGAPFGFDDHFLMAFEDTVLVASTSEMLKGLQVSNGAPLYDWQNMLGVSMFSNNFPPFCLGAEQGLASCSIPEDGGSPGPLSLQFSEEALQGSFLPEITSASFRLVVVGDNDASSDCYHSDLTIDVVATIAPAP